MSEQPTANLAEQLSGIPSDGTQSTEKSAQPEPVDEQLGDAGKRALNALRDEVKALKAELATAKASESADAGTGDPASDSDSPSVGTRDAAADVTPSKPRFQGTGDGGARGAAPDANPQLSHDDLQGMTSKQIETARRNGQLRDLLRGE